MKICCVWILPFALAACGGTVTDVDAAPRGGSAKVVTAPDGPHTVVVFATASLRRPFTELAGHYERAHSGGKVTLRFDGGAELLAAMVAGEKCDVVAIGDSSQMSRFAAAAFLAAGSPTELARNRVAIAVAKDQGDRVRSLEDLAAPGLRVALGTRSSSIGRHARWALSKAKLEVEAAVMAPTADAVLRRLIAGEADAAIVYVTSFADVPGALDAVQRVDVYEQHNTPALYSISVAHPSAEPRGAAAFRALAIGAAGQRILQDAGFAPIGSK
jgi:molybdate transport system substrate-binding protein